jgi:hypothetical protein
MHSTNVQYRDIVHRIAHWGAFRCIDLTDPKPITLSLPRSQYPSDWWCAPGHLNPALLPHFQEAYRRTSSHHALAQLTEWFQQRATTALRDAKKRAPPGRINPAWFKPPIITALLSFSFKPGAFVSGQDEPSTFLTPWHFITSIPEHHTVPDNRIPTGGLEALKIFDIIRNMIFLFHLCFNDIHDATILGAGHSSFSRFSPLAGRLLFLADIFSDRSFQIAWDATHAREAYTKAVFCAISKLWDIFDTWQEEKFSPGDTYRAASAASNPHLILLNPIVDASSREPLLPLLQAWDTDIAVFSIAQLERPTPREGIFNEITPPCFLPRGHRTSSHTRPGDHRNRTTPQQQGPTRHPSRRSDDTPGESTRTQSAKSPLIQPIDPSNKHLSAVLRDINSSRPDHNKLTVPKLGTASSPQQLCFKFTTDTSGGCHPRDGRKCPHVHLDLADAQRCRQLASDKYFDDLFAFLGSDDIKRYFKPSQAFRDFLGRR